MNVLIVDDHPVIRDGLGRLLAGEAGLAVRAAANARDALAAARENPPDLVIIDLNLPGTGGLELIRRLSLAEAGARILVFSMHADPIYVTRALEAGALGYVSKNAAPAEILAAARAVLQGRRYIEQEVAQALAVRTLPGRARDPFEDLSRRELEILRLLGEGRSLVEIAEALGVSYKTVANASTQLKAKLGVERTAELIRIAVESLRD
jgi:DNA-binding NarL/FixJ family response regulator